LSENLTFSRRITVVVLIDEFRATFIKYENSDDKERSITTKDIDLPSECYNLTFLRCGTKNLAVRLSLIASDDLAVVL
jgi:hypothetical protein